MNKLQTSLHTLLIGVIIGIVVTEYRECSDLKGRYDFDSGLCEVEK